MAEIWKTVIVPLAYPITIGERTYTEIKLFEPDADAVEAIEEIGFVDGIEPKFKQLRAAVVALSKMDDAIIGKIHRLDFEQVVEKAVPLLGGSVEPPPPPASPETASTELSPTLPTG